MRKDFSLKFFSMFIALLLDFYLHSPSNQLELEIKADIELKNLPSSRMVIWPKDVGEDGTVKVILKGPEPLLEPLKMNPLPIFVELPSPLPTQYKVSLKASDITLPPGIEVIDFKPAHMDFIFEKVVKRELLVVPKTFGAVKEGYEVIRVSAEPQTVSARGPLNELEKFVSIDTRSVNITNWDRTEDIGVELQEVSGLINLGLNFVTIKVEIRPKQLKRTFKRVNVVVLALPEQDIAARNSTDITLVGDEKYVEKISESQIKLEVDCRDLESGKHLVPIVASLETTEKVEIGSINPSSLLVTVGMKK